jgi:type I restriction-modification system DNA methylase subunit
LGARLPAGLIQFFTIDRTIEGTNEDFDSIGEFAYNEDNRGVEFYTPKSIIFVLGEMPDHVEKAKIIA